MADLDEKGKTLETRLKELTAERAELSGKIDEDLLSRFERLFASKGDAAIVALEHEVCTGCHMKITTQTAHRVKNGKEIVSCEQCGRILYAAEWCSVGRDRSNRAHLFGRTGSPIAATRSLRR